MMYGYQNYGGWDVGTMMGGFGGGFMMIVVWIAVILFVVWVVREIKSGNSRSTSSNALDILKERYAKGEINKEEFESKKKDLS